MSSNYSQVPIGNVHGKPVDVSTVVDVVVIGAGPSGLMTAAELAATGLTVTVLEKRGEPALSRAGVLQPRVMEIFQMRGLASSMLARAQQVNGNRFRTDKGIWAGLPEIDYGLLDSEHNYVVMLSQLEVERILADRCAELGVDLQRGAAVTGLEQRDSEVVVRFVANSLESTIVGAYVVGADGSRSLVREAAGIPWVGEGPRNLAINVDVEMPFPFEKSVTVVNNERGWGLAYPLSETVSRLAVIDAQTMLNVDRDTKIGRDDAFDALKRVFGDDYGRPEARISQFHDALYKAGAMRSGRVLLVGESVRVHYPASGVGMNFCLQDAFNLAWKLAGTLQSWGPPDILDSYETERGPEVEALLDSVRTQTGMQFSFTAESVALKTYFMHHLLPIPDVQKKIAEQLSGIGARYGKELLVGTRLPNLELKTGHLYDGVAVDEYVLLAGADVDDQELDSFNSLRHLRVEVLPGGVAGSNGELVLARPDGYVGAVGNAEQMGRLTHQWRLT